MANKKYKLTDGNMWATDGIHDFGQNKTQRTINSEVNSALGGKAPTNHASTATTYGAASTSNYGHVKLSNTTPSMDGTAAVGDSTDVARANHVHPSDTSRVPTTRKINGMDLSQDRTLTSENIGYNSSTTYSSGTVGKAVSDLNGAINDLSEIKPNIGMFERFAIIGDSFAAGSISTDGETLVDYPSESWGRMLASKYGIGLMLYAKGGVSTHDFMDSTHAYYNKTGFGALNFDTSQYGDSGLYLLCIGINDATADPNSTNIGTSADIKTNPDQNNNTFWGNYGKIIQKIQSINADGRIICCGFKRASIPASDASYANYNLAIKNIAQYFSLPYINPLDNPFFTSDLYLNNMVLRHPTAPIFSAFAKAMDKLIQDCIVDNLAYFKVYTGANIFPASKHLGNNLTTYSYSNVTTENNTVTNLGTVNMPYKGTYIILATAEFAANGTGWRRLGISTSSSSIWASRYLGVQVNGDANNSTKILQMFLIQVTIDNYTLYLNVAQNSGGQLAVSSPGLNIIKIA